MARQPPTPVVELANEYATDERNLGDAKRAVAEARSSLWACERALKDAEKAISITRRKLAERLELLPARRMNVNTQAIPDPTPLTEAELERIGQQLDAASAATEPQPTPTEPE